MTTTIRETVLAQVRLVAEQQKKTLAPLLTDQSRLTESGLDSLCMAIIVANLEDELGIDPFFEERAVEIPATLGEFIRLYENAGA